MFSAIGSSGTVKNLTLAACKILLPARSPYLDCGGIAGNNFGTIENCRVSGSVKGLGYVGGITGLNWGRIIACTNAATVEARVSDEGLAICAGIAGDNYGTVVACYNTGSVSRNADVNAVVGGVVGYNGDSLISCYNTGSTTGNPIAEGGITITSYYYLEDEDALYGYNSSTPVTGGWSTAIGVMNASIGDYNAANEKNPSVQCNYKYSDELGTNGLPFLVPNE